MLNEWAIKWGIPFDAVEDLRVMMRGEDLTGAVVLVGDSEAAVQNHVRIEARRDGVISWRNNVGALKDETGRWVRYGLANESKQMNEHLKSHDLIGIKPVRITPAMVGSVFGQFWSRECKERGWRYSATPREVAQERFAQLVLSYGGDAAFACAYCR